MPSLRRSLLRRYRLFAPHLFRRALVLLAVLLLCDGIAALYFPQIQSALSLNAAASSQSLGVITPIVTAMTASPDPASVLASDTFQRPDQLYWGISSTGQSWQADANSARNFAISHSTGIINATAKPIFCDAILGPVAANVEITFSASLSHYGPSTLGAALRWSDPNNLYKVYLDGQNLVLLRAVDGMVTPLQMIPFPARDGALYTFRFRASGSQLSAMVWPSDQPAPASWQISLSDDALSTGRAGIRVFAQNGAQARITSFQEVRLP